MSPMDTHDRPENASLQRALKLNPDGFTPLARTPWAGTEIQKRYKDRIKPSQEAVAIGESWEVSCDPAFPSQVLGMGKTLLKMVEESPDLMLSPAYVQKKGANCEILIKLLNAASPLSVQVHPRDGDSALKADECGKPESWLILDAEPGAGLYLGFSRALTRDELRTLLKNDADLRPFLHFVPVQAGDYFEIQPGVPHAIGPGITLLEPQRVLLGKSGKTYRFWDWGRRYDASGALDMQRGEARELHIEEGLRLIDPEQQVGEKFVAGLRRKPEVFSLKNGGMIARYPANESYQVLRVQAPQGQSLRLQLEQGFATLVSLGGQFSWQKAQADRGVDSQNDASASVAVSFSKGEPGFLPYGAFPQIVSVSEQADFILVTPRDCQLSWTEV